MHPWLLPSIIASSAAAIVLFLVYGYLLRSDHQESMRLWTWGWGFYAVRFVFVLLGIGFGHKPIFLGAEQLATLASAYFLLWGARSFGSQGLPWPWHAGCVVMAVWIPAAIAWGAPADILYLPTFLFMGAVQIYAGATILRFVGGKSPVKTIAGWTFILWGIHKFNYPWLRPVEWFAPWGFLLGALFVLIAAIAVVLLYFEQVQRELKESEKRFRRLVDNSTDPLFLLDSSGRFLDVNPAACASLGYTRDEMLQRSVPDVDPTTAGMDFQAQWDSIPFDQSVAFETLHCRKDSATFPVEIHAWAFDEAGKRFIIGQARDITARKRMEEQLITSEKQFRDLFETAPMGIMVLDSQTKVLEANQYATVFFGYDPAELIQILIKDNIHPDDLAALSVESVLEQLRTHSHLCLVRRYRRKDGAYIPVEATIKQIQGLGDYLLMFTDITERVRAAESLKLSEQRFHSLFNNMAEGVALHELICDQAVAPIDYTIVEVNAQYESILGVARADLLHKSACLIYNSETPPYLDLYSQVALTGAAIHFETYFPPMDRYFSISVAPWGERGFATIFTDISQRKRTEGELREAMNAAEAANRAKSEFLATMSHEIRTPLNGVLGMLQLLKFSTVLSSEQKKFVDIGLASGKNLLLLLTDILDLSRIEAGKIELQTNDFALADVIAAVENAFLVPCAEKGLTLAARLDPTIPQLIRGDEARIRQIIFNLVGNAVKFSQTGNVTIEVSPLPPRPGENTRLLFAIGDSGAGIPDDKLELIFERFTQTDSSSTRPHQGAGLGLAIVKRLVLLMGGAIAVDSEVGAGSTFYVALPLRAALLPAAPEQNDHPADAQAYSSLRILLAEDDPTNQIAGKYLLELLGHTVACAADGREALQLLDAQPFDIVLMDVQMPEMDGIEATRQLRDPAYIGANANIPIIAVTAHAMDGDEEQFLAVGMDAYVAKPVDMDNLKAAIDKALALRRCDRAHTAR